MRDLRFQFKTHYSVSRALVIGIDKYKAASPLSYAVSDAVSIKDLLVSNFEFLESDVTLLTDEDATRQSVLRAFHRFTNDDVGLDDRLVVFFAGHGHTRTGSRGEIGYLVPHDADGLRAREPTGRPRVTPSSLKKFERRLGHTLQSKGRGRERKGGGVSGR